MFRGLSLNTTPANDADEKKAIHPTLRNDLYSAVDQVKAWLAGARQGDGVSYGPILAIIQKHFPETKIGMESFGRADDEVAVIVAGVTNMVLELGKWESMAGAMATRTWADALANAFTKYAGPRKDAIARGISRGVNNANVTLLTTNFTAKIQIISSLKSVITRIYGAGTSETRQAEATFSSKFI
ncbi:hypothetical protein CYLTODRAFT_397546 [Cylindrobasidium torrendii FP15055 ss-10]|uniref:Uncharacterized protein n=1 Tax=Cylindrobasidium torrendii FP15055 ss-10 TaxID=1314674 RepID=A0A0D7B9J5_9AGAR|nr:hypothetical protein CYLTODRAFT_397546 [Cylindrobasidium torrendii FP15055 ss-10]